MSNSTATTATFKPAAQTPSLLRELFQATPLYIFVTAAKAAFAAKR